MLSIFNIVTIKKKSQILWSLHNSKRGKPMMINYDIVSLGNGWAIQQRKIQVFLHWGSQESVPLISSDSNHHWVIWAQRPSHIASARTYSRATSDLSLFCEFVWFLDLHRSRSFQMFPVLETKGRDNPSVSQWEGAAQECPSSWALRQSLLLEELKRNYGAVLQLGSMWIATDVG